MCTDLHKQTPEALAMFRAIEEESKFVPSQFDRRDISQIVRDGMTKMHAEGFELAKLRILRLLLAHDAEHDAELYGKIWQQIEELKP